MPKNPDRSKVRFRVADLDSRSDTGESYDFTPSYNLEREAYDAKIELCRSCVDDEKTFYANRCLREGHRLLRGGRVQQRYGRAHKNPEEKPKPLTARRCAGCKKQKGVFAIYGAYWHPRCFRKASEAEREQARADMSTEMDKTVPRGKKNPAPREPSRRTRPAELPRRSQRATERLDGSEPPLNRRTQSPASAALAEERKRNKGKARAAVQASRVVACRRAIETIVGDQKLFRVPSSLAPLERAGMPFLEAKTLIDRAGGSVIARGGALRPILADGPAGLLPQQLRNAMTKHFREAVLIDLKGRKVRGERSGHLDVRDPNGLLLGVIDTFQLRGSRNGRTVSVDVTTDQGGNAFEWEEQYDNDRTPATFFTRMLTTVHEQLQAAKKRLPDVRVVVRFKDAKLGEVVLGEEAIKKSVVSTRAHYRSFRGVSVEELPELLVALANRKKRRGRRLKRV